MKFSEKQKTQLLVTGFIGAVLMVIVLYFHFMIGRGQINDFESRGDRVTQEIAEARAELDEINGLLAQEDLLEEQRQMIAKVVRRLPSTRNADGFLTSLVTVLRQTGIFQEVVRPEAIKPFSQYTEIPYHVDAQGRYHELGQFLTLIEQSPDRFMRVKNFTVQNNLKRPSIHPIKMDIATFMFNDNNN